MTWKHQIFLTCDWRNLPLWNPEKWWADFHPFTSRRSKHMEWLCEFPRAAVTNYYKWVDFNKTSALSYISRGEESHKGLFGLRSSYPQGLIPPGDSRAISSLAISGFWKLPASFKASNTHSPVLLHHSLLTGISLPMAPKWKQSTCPSMVDDKNRGMVMQWNRAHTKEWSSQTC